MPTLTEMDHSARVSRLDQHFKSHLSKLVLFLEFALESLCKFNAVFQSTLVMLPSEVKRNATHPFWSIHEVMKAAGEDISNINIEDEDEVTDNELGIGHKAWELQEDYMDPNVQHLFFNGVQGPRSSKRFHLTIISWMMWHFLPENRDKVTTTLVLRLAGRFLAATPCDCLDEVEEETLEYTLKLSNVR